ncbi:MAG: hypothetical protein GXO86_08005, partial [Chlorobi bacterium]|nr:hypothetical protein [Chlorobiota bacterium]
MNKLKYLKCFFLLFLFLITFSVFPQNGKEKWFQKDIKKANNYLQHQFIEKAKVEGENEITTDQKQINDLHRTLTHILEIREKLPFLISGRSADTVYLGDTLVIGATPGDELVIESEWFQPGPIIIIGDGILRFRNAKATILGDLFTVQDAQVIVDSSYL